ncbi:MAG: hypothetical protein ABR597_11130 [Bacteroidales bacterium]
MNKTVLIENWYKQKGWNKIKFGNLADENLVIDEGKKDEMSGRLQKKAGKTKEEIGKLI